MRPRKTIILGLFVLGIAAGIVDALPKKDTWYTRHYFLMQDYERKAYKGLSDNGRLEFQKVYWEFRSPAVKEEFDRRMAYILPTFKNENSSQPWNTDRARIYLLNGRPARLDEPVRHRQVVGETDDEPVGSLPGELHLVDPDRPLRHRARDGASAEPAPDLLSALLAAAVEPEHDEVLGDVSLEVSVGVAADVSDAAGVVVVRDANVVVLLRHAVGTAAAIEAQVRAWAGEFHVVEIRGDERAREVLGRVRDVAPGVGVGVVAGGQLREHLEAGQVVLYRAAGVEAAAERAAREGRWPPLLRALTVATLAALARPEAVRR